MRSSDRHADDQRVVGRPALVHVVVVLEVPHRQRGWMSYVAMLTTARSRARSPDLSVRQGFELGGRESKRRISAASLKGDPFAL